MNRLLPSALALLLLVGCAAPGAEGDKLSAATPQSAPQQSALQEAGALPEQLGPLRRNGPVLDFERQPGGTGMGAGLRYVPANGERITVSVYIYDRGRQRGPEGGDSPDLVEELRLSSAELGAAVRGGVYRSMKLEAGMNLGRNAAPPDLRCTTFSGVQRDGARTGDSICVTVQQGRFVKVRLTVWNPPEPALAGLMAGAILQNIRGIRAGGAVTPDSLPSSALRT